jgi:hypothetical protein
MERRKQSGSYETNEKAGLWENKEALGKYAVNLSKLMDSTLSTPLPTDKEEAVSSVGDDVVKMILDECERQYSQEGWSEKHDDGHDGGELALAAACYAAFPMELYTTNKDLYNKFVFEKLIPFGEYQIDKKHSEMRRLTISASLIIQEMRRLRRISTST